MKPLILSKAELEHLQTVLAHYMNTSHVNPIIMSIWEKLNKQQKNK